MLANEEVTADGRSERGNFPVYRRPLKQWMLRITSYADRLLDDLDRARLVGFDQADATQLDRPLDRREREVPGRRASRTSRSRSSRRGPTRCSARRTWCSRPSIRSSTRSPRTSGPATTSSSTGRATSSTRGRASSALTDPPPDAVRRYREFALQKTDLERQAEAKAGEDRRVHRRRSRSTRRTTSASRSSSPTTC